jgi:hypothetical protein
MYLCNKRAQMSANIALDARIVITFRVRKLTGRAVAQAVRCRLHTVAALVRTQISSCGICGGQSIPGALNRLLHTHHHISPSGAGTIGQ